MNKKITFTINGKKYTAKTNKKGIATLTLKNLKVGMNTLAEVLELPTNVRYQYYLFVYFII